MNKNQYNKILNPDREDPIWELYHENSKQSQWYTVKMDDDQISAYFKQTHLSLPYDSDFIKKLDISGNELEMSLSQAMKKRKSSKKMKRGSLSFEEVSSIMYSGFGITRPDEKPRPLRSVPSGGKLFPLEAYCYVSTNKHLPAGLYHYNAEKNHLALLKRGNHEYILADAMVQSNFANHCGMIVFITAVFKRSTIKYGEKAYRLIHLEAGHAAQNLNLTAAALGLACRNVSAFYDRRIESYLDIDGIDQSIIYMIVLGKEEE